MCAEAARRLAAAVEPRYDLTLHVLHLALGIDPQAGARIVGDRRRPGRLEGGLRNLELGRRLAKVVVSSRVDK